MTLPMDSEVISIFQDLMLSEAQREPHTKNFIRPLSWRARFKQNEGNKSPLKMSALPNELSASLVLTKPISWDEVKRVFGSVVDMIMQKVKKAETDQAKAGGFALTLLPLELQLIICEKMVELWPKNLWIDEVYGRGLENNVPLNLFRAFAHDSDTLIELKNRFYKRACLEITPRNFQMFQDKKVYQSILSQIQTLNISLWWLQYPERSWQSPEGTCFIHGENTSTCHICDEHRTLLEAYQDFIFDSPGVLSQATEVRNINFDFGPFAMHGAEFCQLVLDCLSKFKRVKRISITCCNGPIYVPKVESVPMESCVIQRKKWKNIEKTLDFALKIENQKKIKTGI